MLVPYVDLTLVNQPIRSLIDKAINDTIDSSSYITGYHTENLEQRLSEYLCCEDVAAVGSGTMALVLALAACGVGPGDQVITTPLSFISTTEAIVTVGADPVFVDIDDSGLIDLNMIEQKITSKTKAILAVDLYGQSTDKRALSDIAHKYGIYYINDCAHSFGSDQANIADLSCFSFNPLKNLGALGDAGAVGGKKHLVDQIKSLRNHGRDQDGVFSLVGYNARIDNIQANILSTKLQFVDKWNSQRIEIANRYSTNLSDYVSVPKLTGYSKHVYYAYVISTDNREGLKKYLNANHVGTNIHYPYLCSRAPSFSKYYSLTFNAERFHRRILSLPCYPGLTEQKQNYVIDLIRKWKSNEL